MNKAKKMAGAKPLFSIGNIIRFVLFAYFLFSGSNSRSGVQKAMEVGAHVSVFVVARVGASVAQYISGIIHLSRMVKAGKVRPDAVRLARNAGDRQTLFSIAALVACASFACYCELHRTVILIAYSTIFLPLLRVVMHPRFTPFVIVVLASAVLAWWYEGMREMFVGVVLFQAVPCLNTAIDLLGSGTESPNTTSVNKSRLKSILKGIVMSMVVIFILAPILSVSAVALFKPQILSLMLTKVKDSRVQTLWNLVSYFEMIMGVGSKEVDPYRLLGLSVNASERDINKRWRTLSVKYHPDKTGNDPIKKAHFMQLQKAKEMLLSGKSNAMNTSKDIKTDRLVGLVEKSMGSLIIVCLWIGMNVLELMRSRKKDKDENELIDVPIERQGEREGEAVENIDESEDETIPQGGHEKFAPTKIGGARRRKVGTRS